MLHSEGKENVVNHAQCCGRRGKHNGKARAAIRREEQRRKDAAWKLVCAADAHMDPLAELLSPASQYFAPLNVQVRCVRPQQLSREERDEVWALIKNNMQSWYEASDQGWDERVKRQEDFDEKAWFLLATKKERKPEDTSETKIASTLVGLANFRFDLDFDDPVVYCYEVQVCHEARRHGLARFLLLNLLQMAGRTNMRKVMATVFKNNSASRHLFIDKMRFSVDETDPSAAEDDVTAEYLIVSRMLPTIPHASVIPST